MRLSTSNIGAGLVAILGIFGIYSITKTKTQEMTHLEHLSPHSRNGRILYYLNQAEEKEAEIIGDYLAHGIGGSVFRLPSGTVPCTPGTGRRTARCGPCPRPASGKALAWP